MLLERHAKRQSLGGVGRFVIARQRDLLDLAKGEYELKYRLHNAKFTNKDVPRPATAKHVQSQYQVDVVALINDPVKQY